MSASVLYMSMSLDGYIADQDDQLGGEDGNRLHEWFVFTSDGEIRADGPAAALIDEANATGAVLVGRRTAEIVDHWGGDHHGRGVPIFVPSHRPPGPSVRASASKLPAYDRQFTENTRILRIDGISHQTCTFDMNHTSWHTPSGFLR